MEFHSSFGESWQVCVKMCVISDRSESAAIISWCSETHSCSLVGGGQVDRCAGLVG